MIPSIQVELRRRSELTKRHDLVLPFSLEIVIARSVPWGEFLRTLLQFRRRLYSKRHVIEMDFELHDPPLTKPTI